MNAVIIAVVVMLVLSLIRVNVVFSLVIGAFIGGISAGLSINETLEAFTGGLGNGATIALSYGLLGGFAVAISSTGIPQLLISKILKLVSKEGETEKAGLIKSLIFFFLLLMAVFSQNLIPIHIAFIPLLVPPIISILNMLKVDRRLIASILTFGLVTPYMLLPFGFGSIYHEIIATQIKNAGVTVSVSDIPRAMIVPALGLVFGLIIAFWSYRKPRTYSTTKVSTSFEEKEVKTRQIFFALLSLIAALVSQIQTSSMIIGALVGILVLYVSGTLKWSDADRQLTEGMRMMAFIGFVIITASGFATVMQQTGDIENLVKSATNIIGNQKGLAVLIMLIIGLVVTMGIGSSFATIPIIAAIFVPLSVELGLSNLAIIALIGTAGALGDAGSPASDSTLGPTAGLNIDGQHNHIWDTCIPTFIHYNIPLIVFGWIGVMLL